MSYTVFARKYRPQRFDDLVGQEHVTRTLGNAIEAGRVAHAFLFTGVRGVGKTSTARLLAKALNCVEGPTRNACNACEPCREITTGTDMDVQEIDGASNNSVDDVRRLQESLPYRPARDRFKIVIVDEVHMLSAGAFNAFLKTLEEPPPHVKFIFATTEVHKVPVTIRSRCQRYDFRLIPRSVIAHRIREILQAESVQADEATLSTVASEAAGSMRDALTLLDQIVAFAGDTLGVDDVTRGLGIADRGLVFQVAEAVLQGDAAACLRHADTLATQGLDVLHFVRQLVSFSRDLIVLQVVGDDSELVDLVDEERVAAAKLAHAHPREELERMFASLSTLADEVARSGIPKLTLEMGLVRLADRPRLQPLAELMARLEALGERLGGSPPPSDGGGRGGTRSPSSQARPAGATQPRVGASTQGPIGHKSAPTPSRQPPPAQSSDKPRPSQAVGRDEGQSTSASRPAVAVAPAPPSSQPTVRSSMSSHDALADGAAARVTDDAQAEEPQARPRNAPPESVVAAPQAAAAAPADDVDVDAEQAWSDIITRLRDLQPALGAVLEHGVAVHVDREKLEIAFPRGSFFGKQAGTQEARDSIAAAARAVLGAAPQLEISYATDLEKLGVTVKQKQDARLDALRAERRKQALEHPRVLEAMKVFPEAEGKIHVEVDDD